MVAESMSKNLWIKKLGIMGVSASLAGVAVGAIAWQVTENSAEETLVQPLRLSAAPGEAGKLSSCCVAPDQAMAMTKPMELPALGTATSTPGAEAPAVCPLGYTSSDPNASAHVTSTPAAGTEVCPMGYTSEPKAPVTDKAAAAPAPAPAPTKHDTSAREATPRFRYLATLAQAGSDPLALPAPSANDASPSLDLASSPSAAGAELSATPAAPASDVDALINDLSLPEYKGKSKTFEKVAPRLEEKKAQQAATKEEDDESFIPEPLFPPLTKPLTTVEDYQQRLEQVEAIGREMATTAERVNNTAGQWKELHDKVKAQNDELAKQIEQLKARNRQLLIEKGELMKNPGTPAASTTRNKNTERAKDLNKPLLNITEKDLGLPERTDIKDLPRVQPPPPARPVAAAPAAPRLVRAPDGTVYEAAPQRPQPYRAPAAVPVVPPTMEKPLPPREKLVMKPSPAPALNNLPAPFPGSQPSPATDGNPNLKPPSREELAAYNRWQKENGRPVAPNTAPVSSGTATSSAGGEKKWEWDPVTGNIRRTQ